MMAANLSTGIVIDWLLVLYDFTVRTNDAVPQQESSILNKLPQTSQITTSVRNNQFFRPIRSICRDVTVHSG